MAKIIEFPRHRLKMKERALSALNEINQLEGADKEALDTVIDHAILSMVNDLYKIDFRFTEKGGEFAFNVLVEMLKACIYRNQYIDHPYSSVVDEIVSAAESVEESKE